MGIWDIKGMAFPPLREEVDLIDGPSLSDGQPSWTLHDPVRNLFFRIDWPTFEVLQRWVLGDVGAIADDISTGTTLQLHDEDVSAVVEFMVNNELVQVSGIQAPRQMAYRWAKMRGGAWQWILHHYLFFRIPLLKPDAWLTRWMPVAEAFYSRAFVVMTAVALAYGLSNVFRQWDRFFGSLVDTLNWDGIWSYGIAVVVVKLMHELGHAFTAKRYGCRVPTIGVAFLVMCPLAYTDTNETWRLKDRMQRLHVACAGILTELMIAAWATLAWSLLPDGGLRSAVFFLATTTWVTTLAVNASPFLRFDGYFILSDALDLPNLHARSFALARWKLREWLFDLQEPVPEFFKPAMRRALIAFAWVTWIHRLVVFIGIAVLVYVSVFKLLGVFLFGVEIVWFVLSPIRSEVHEWRKRWAEIRNRPRSVWSALGGLCLLLLTVIPWPGRISASAMLHPAEVWPVFAPSGAIIRQLPYKEGDEVSAGAQLLSLHVPDLAMRGTALQVKLEQSRWQAAASTLDEEFRKRLLIHQQNLVTTQAEVAGLRAEQSQYEPRAPFAGRLRDMDPDLHVGQWVSRKEKLAVLVKEDGRWVLETWLEESAVQRLRQGDSAVFRTDNVFCAVVKASVTSIDKDASRVLLRPELSSMYGGHILTRARNGQLIPESAIYRVTLTPEAVPSELMHQSWRGQLVLHGRWEAPVWHYIRQGVMVLVRELGF